MQVITKNNSMKKHTMKIFFGPIVWMLFIFLSFSIMQAQESRFISARPPLNKRKFTSEAVEREIVRVNQKLADPELRRMFDACYPNTLDTCVSFTTTNGKPDTFIITGDINAMWLRDSAAEVQAYLPLCKTDNHLSEMIAGLIHRQAVCIMIDPYANAFFKDDTKPSPHLKDVTEMRPGIFERKWELDSLSYCIRLAYQYWKVTGNSAAFDPEWWKAMRLAEATMRDQQREKSQGAYRFIRGRASAGEVGFGSPIKPTGMICTAFRESDDPTTYLFNIPENLFAVTALRQLAEMSDRLLPGDGFAAECRALANEVEKGIQDHGTTVDPKYGKMYVYECDGLGHTLLMDDAGLPSLVSIPYFTPSLAGNPVVLATRRFALGPDNPYFSKGTVAEGECSPHKGQGYIWPMGIVSRVITSSDDAEIIDCLAMLKRSTAGTSFMHESFNMDDATKYSRRWFAWANNLFGEMILNIFSERTQLLATPMPVRSSATNGG